MTIHDALLEAKMKLETAGIPSPWLDAELLLSSVLQKPRSYLITHTHDHLNKVTIQQFNKATSRRCRGEPLAYLTGEQEFCGLTFKVTNDVLIPRPATEELVETVIFRYTGERPPALPRGRFAPTILDIGTGSGCIAITLAKRIPYATIIAADISERALAIARENARRHGVANRITFLQGDLLEPVLTSQTERLINRQTVLVANLPYVPTAIFNAKPELQFEPKEALNGGQDGTLLYRQLFNQLSLISDQWLPSLIAFEVDDSIADTLLGSEEARKLLKWYTYQRQNHILSFHPKHS